MSESDHPIRQYRLAQTPPMTLDALAARVGITKASLSRIETGKLSPSIGTLRKLATVTGIALAVLAKDFTQPEAAE